MGGGGGLLKQFIEDMHAFHTLNIHVIKNVYFDWL